MDNTAISRSGFTLIELSITLVIIGLLVGGILTGQDLINSAASRAQITQIERYNTAVRTFQTKYSNYLPGDIPDPYATQFGFQPRGTNVGQGDGNGLLDGNGDNGEQPLFGEDLSQANLIEGTFNTATCCTYPPTVTGTSLNQYLPTAKIGNGNYIYVYDGGYWNGFAWISDGFNYYGLSAITSLDPHYESNPMLTTIQAYNIDIKTDDGLPQSGNVTARYMNNNITSQSYTWAAGGGLSGANGGGNAPAPTTVATPYATTNCYDNSYAGGSAATQKYQIGKNANLQNCALSFKFQ